MTCSTTRYHRQDHPHCLASLQASDAESEQEKAASRAVAPKPASVASVAFAGVKTGAVDQTVCAGVAPGRLCSATWIAGGTVGMSASAAPAVPVADVVVVAG